MVGISIHAPVKGATGCRPGRHPRPRYFNPRTREGCDRMSGAPTGRTTRISIHAPVKGATRRRDHRVEVPTDFNPRTREGCDIAAAITASRSPPISIHAPVKGATTHAVDRMGAGRFQSTHP